MESADLILTNARLAPGPGDHRGGVAIRDGRILWVGPADAVPCAGPCRDLEGRVLLSPGHTLASITYVIGDAAFVHDTLMMPDSGTSRADFPGGSAKDLYRSLERILALPDDTRIYVGHDYGRGGRKPRWESTVREERETNIHLRGNVSEAEYVRIRESRDDELELPHLMLYALQVNIRGGRLPEAEDNEVSYLRIPMNQFAGPSKVCPM